ncbi:MAG: hypothetical protein PVH29_12380 [Candidatus Zixiibacteriota bacterium]
MEGFYGDWDKFEREVATFSDRLERNMARATRRNGEYTAGQMKRHILSQRGEVKFSKLAKSTRRRKLKKGRKQALVESGQLSRAFTCRVVGLLKAIVGVQRYVNKNKSSKGFNVPEFHEKRFHFVRDVLERVRDKCLERWEKAFERTVQGS